MPFYVDDLLWLQAHYAKAGDQDASDELADNYKSELESTDHDKEVILLFKHCEKYQRQLQQFRTDTPSRSHHGPPLPQTMRLANIPTPVGNSRSAKKREGNWPAHIETDNPVSTDHEIPIDPGPYYDLAAAKSIALRGDCPNVDLASYAFITAIYRQDTMQREKARENEIKELQSKCNGPLSLITQFEDIAVIAWMENLAKSTDEVYPHLHYRDLRTIEAHSDLQHPGNLNDNVIDFFMMLVADALTRRHRKVWAIVSAFNRNVHRGKWEDLKKWATKAKFNEATYQYFDSVIIPWNTGTHWVLVIVEPKHKRICTWDSLRFGTTPMSPSKAENEAAAGVRAFLEQIVHHQWSRVVRFSPQQDDAAVCGVVACYNAASYAVNMESSAVPRINKETANEMRRWILLVCKEGKLTDENLGRVR